MLIEPQSFDSMVTLNNILVAHQLDLMMEPRHELVYQVYGPQLNSEFIESKRTNLLPIKHLFLVCLAQVALHIKCIAASKR